MKLNERFWNKVEVQESNECWIWKGATEERGYGLFNFEGITKYAHRVAYTLTYGEIPKGLVVRHKCDNPCCCNPSHLELGTQQDNSTDKVLRGHSTAGEKHSNSKLCEAEVLNIYKLICKGKSNKDIAKMYGCSAANISNIACGKSWKHLYSQYLILEKENTL